MRQLFFIGNKLLGETSRQLVYVHGELQCPASYLWFCPYCGEVYARAPVMLPGNEGKVSKWQALCHACPRCDAPRYHSLESVPGSLWLSWDEDYLAALPNPVLQREAALHFAYYDRINHD